MNSARDALAMARTILLVDWPDRSIPETLARAGYRVLSQEGPDTYVAYEVEGAEVVARPLGGPPEQADLVYLHRPFDELPEIVELAKRVGARAIWSEAGPDAPGAADARRLVEAAGLRYVDTPRITEAVPRP